MKIRCRTVLLCGAVGGLSMLLLLGCVTFRSRQMALTRQRVSEEMRTAQRDQSIKSSLSGYDVVLGINLSLVRDEDAIVSRITLVNESHVYTLLNLDKDVFSFVASVDGKTALTEDKIVLPRKGILRLDAGESVTFEVNVPAHLLEQRFLSVKHLRYLGVNLTSISQTGWVDTSHITDNDDKSGP